MGTGIYGGFGLTYGLKMVAASPTFVGKGQGEDLAVVAKKIAPEEGFLDVVIHGTNEKVAYFHHGEWVYLDQRRLANLLKHEPEFNKKTKIRLISCSTGKDEFGFAQNLANKLGVEVKAPTNTVWISPSGSMFVGKSFNTKDGGWVNFKPGKKVKNGTN